jgi:hypothetical protein
MHVPLLSEAEQHVRCNCACMSACNQSLCFGCSGLSIGEHPNGVCSYAEPAAAAPAERIVISRRMVGAAVGMGPVAIAEKIGALRSAEELLQLVEAHGARFSGEHVQSALASLAKAVCSQRIPSGHSRCAVPREAATKKQHCRLLSPAE